MPKDALTGPVRTGGPARLDVKEDSGLVGPVRTRGALRLGRPTEAPAEVHTRGAVRTRGAVNQRTQAPVAKPVATLADMVNDLREATGGMPLTTLIHGTDTAASREFARLLRPKCERDDALWLTGTGGSVAKASAEFDEASALDLSMDTDQRVYANLICDLVFFPAIGNSELADVRHWSRRTSALVVELRGAKARELTDAGRKAGLRTYGWRGGEALE